MPGEVSTDLFGRGIDIERVNIVINYDMPVDVSRIAPAALGKCSCVDVLASDNPMRCVYVPTGLSYAFSISLQVGGRQEGFSRGVSKGVVKSGPVPSSAALLTTHPAMTR